MIEKITDSEALLEIASRMGFDKFAQHFTCTLHTYIFQSYIENALNNLLDDDETRDKVAQTIVAKYEDENSIGKRQAEFIAKLTHSSMQEIINKSSNYLEKDKKFNRFIMDAFDIKVN